MSRHASQASSQSSADFSPGASYNLILEHILTLPGTYAIPLRTMYTLNSTPRAQPSRPATPTGLRPAPELTAQFQSSLIDQVSSLPTQPCSLPPAFITTFLRRCFPADLTLVDFPQALTALDYLKDLETRRRREFRSALGRLNVTHDVLRSEHESQLVFARYPGFKRWLSQNESNERKVEAYYTQLYVALRRWVLINELSLEPFSKTNCLAMLNTLYPPFPPGASADPSQQPTAQLTPQVLNSQRSGFFEWIKKVEACGPSVLEPLMQQGKRKPRLDAHGNTLDDPNGWGAVRDCLDSYLRVANAVIEDCRTLESMDNFDDVGKRPRTSTGDDARRSGTGRESRSSRKADSGVSFNGSENGGGKRPSTSSSVGPRDKSRIDVQEPTSPDTFEPRFPPARSGGSALEKIAREIRKIRLVRSSPVSAASKSRPTSPSPTDTSHRPGHRESVDDRAARPRSRAGTFVRNLSRPRSRSRARSQTATGHRAPEHDEVPPTPTIPASFMDYSDDDDDDRHGRSRARSQSRFRRSMSISRGNVLRRMKSMGDTKERGRQNERLFGSADAVAFDPQEMRRQRQRWEASQAESSPVLREDEFFDDDNFVIGEAV